MAVIDRILARIRAEPGEAAWLTRDFHDLGSASQVQRALRALVAEAQLARVSTGVYTPLRRSTITGGATLTVSFDTLVRRAMSRLGIPFKEDPVLRAYNAGRTN